MKTLKNLKEESVKFYTENAKDYFSKSFSKKMGGIQKITFEDDFLPEIVIDERKYYSGSAAKYNNNSMHEHIDVFVTKKEFENKVNWRAETIFESEKSKFENKKLLKKYCEENNLPKDLFYYIDGDALLFKYNKKEEVEKFLNIDLSEFFSTNGKTYFFADTKIGLLMFFHNNHQSYSFERVSEEKRQEFLAGRERWVNAPFSFEVGQTDNINLYVC